MMMSVIFMSLSSSQVSQDTGSEENFALADAVQVRIQLQAFNLTGKEI